MFTSSIFISWSFHYVYLQNINMSALVTKLKNKNKKMLWLPQGSLTFPFFLLINSKFTHLRLFVTFMPLKGRKALLRGVYSKLTLLLPYLECDSKYSREKSAWINIRKACDNFTFFRKNIFTGNLTICNLIGNVTKYCCFIFKIFWYVS